MLSILNLWAFFLPSLLVVGAPTTLSPGDTSLAKVHQAFETQALTDDIQISSAMHTTFDPIILFEVTSLNPTQRQQPSVWEDSFAKRYLSILALSRNPSNLRIRRLASNEQPSYPIQTLVNSPTSPLRSTHVSCLRWRNATPKSTSSGTPYKMR
ncbi:hypothetical protein BC826DRAFT_973355 [Russula brevipes]|nr:hypothetical protein BC826DRAFT_973355 [Russula brevipes]